MLQRRGLAASVHISGLKQGYATMFQHCQLASDKQAGWPSIETAASTCAPPRQQAPPPFRNAHPHETYANVMHQGLYRSTQCFSSAQNLSQLLLRAQNMNHMAMAR